nr:T9SS type A sorting domain-containing protein [Saprospiraceae bacterium]
NIFFDISDQDFSITGPQALTGAVSDTPISCADSNDGSLSAEAFGGQAPYSFEWSTGSEIPTIDNLAPGSYGLTITDEEGTIWTELIQIDTLKPLDILLSGIALSCNESNSGSIQASVTGGVPPYQYQWQGPDNYTGSGASIAELAGGNYQLTVTDYRGCQHSADITLFNPNTRFYYDADKDGYGDDSKWLDACFEPTGYVKIAGDCADDNSHLNPGVKEVCDGFDNNCDGQIDEGFERNWVYLDADGDGFGDPAQGILACVVPPNYTMNDEDCQDGDSSVYPGAPEICDGQDNDCDNMIDEGGCRLTMEHGNLKRLGGEWQTIHLQEDYESMVVIANVILPSDEQKPVVTRIQNVGHNSFEVKLQNPAGEAIGYYGLTYFVVEEGSYNEAEHGVNLEAHRYQSNTTSSAESWQLSPQVYLNSYQEPVVLGQVMTYNDTRWSSFWSSSTTDRASAADVLGFSLGKHVGEDADTERLPETLGYVVVEAGMYEFNGVHFYADLGDDSVRGVSNSSAGYSYGTPLGQLDCAVASMATMKGLDGGFPVLFTDDPFGQRGKLMLAIDEDQILDQERSHNGERVSFLAFGSPDVGVTYCEAGATSSEYEWIESLSIGDLTHQSGNNDGYGDFSDMEIYAARGEEVLFSLMPGTTTNNYPEYWNIWIDFNQDGDFMDEDEVILELESHRGMYIDQFMIPHFAKTGPTRIRVAMKWGDFSPACGVTGWGEVEDYTLIIEPAPEARTMRTHTEMQATPAREFRTQIYPNPSSDQLNISWEKGASRPSQWRITDVSGKVLQEQSWTSRTGEKSTAIEVRHLQTGIYYLVLIDQEGKRETLPFAKVP